MTADHDERAELPVAETAVRYYDELQALLGELDLEELERAVDALRRARDDGAMIYVAGNGGSAATASHLVNDLGKATKRSGRRPLRVMGLTDNVSWLTALGNDEGYERVFTGQLENFATEGDLLIVITASGNSPNVLDALRHAGSTGMTSIALLGFDGGAAKGMADICLWLPSERGAYGIVESGHSVVCDILTQCLIDDRAGGE